MKPIYILLDNHTDFYIFDLLQENMPWIVKNFSTVLMESAPMQLTGAEALEYYFDKIKTYTLDTSNLPKGILKEEDSNFLAKPYEPSQMAPDIFIEKRIAALSIMGKQVSQLYGILKGYQFFANCLKQGIELRGAEPSSYRPGLGIFEPIVKRDVAMHQALNSAANTSLRGVFFIVGASHGINLIQALAKSGQHSCSFVRLATEDKLIEKSPGSFGAWYKNEMQMLNLGPENQVSELIIPRDWPSNIQTKLLEESLRVVQGAALPENMERDLSTGLVSVKTGP